MNIFDNPAIRQLARAMNDEAKARSKMEIGKNIMHPDGYMVHILSGQYLDPIYGRVSNFWRWVRVNDDGSLATEVEHGYGW